MFGIPFLTPKVLEVLGVVVITLALTAFIYHEGGNAPRAQMAALQASIAAAKKVHDAEDAAKSAQTSTLITTLENNHANAVKNSAADWAAYLAAQLRNQHDRDTKHGAQSARTEAHVCNDPDKDRGLSDAIQSFKLGARSALQLCMAGADEFRNAVGQRLEGAQRESIDLAACTAYVAGVRQINAAPTP